VTYAMMEEAWRAPAETGARPDWMEPFARTIDAAKKYVVSSTLAQVDWNADLVRGDLEGAVGKLKRELGRGPFVAGVKLAMALTELRLIDEYEFVVRTPTITLGTAHQVFRRGVCNDFPAPRQRRPRTAARSDGGRPPASSSWRGARIAWIKPMPSRRLISLALLAALTACQGANSPDGAGAEGQQVQLRSFASCSELEETIERRLIAEVNGFVDRDLAERLAAGAGERSNDGLGGSGQGGAGGTGRGIGGMGGDGGMAGASGQSPDDLGEVPLNQRSFSLRASFASPAPKVMGVEEPDFFKTDGQHIFVLRHGRLYVARSWPPAAMALVAELPLTGEPMELLLDEGGRLVVISRDHVTSVIDRAGRSGGADPFSGASEAADPCAHQACATPAVTRVTIVEFREGRLEVVGQTHLPGEYRTARRVGSAAHIVITQDFSNVLDGVDGVERQIVGAETARDKRALEKAAASTKKRNETLIRARPLEYWLGQGVGRARDGRRVDLGYACNEMETSTAPEDLGFVTLASIDLARPTAPPVRRTLLASAVAAYASPTSLYVASATHASASPAWAGRTLLHRFGMTSGLPVTHLASGSFPGRPLSFDEHEGLLRLAAWEGRHKLILVLGTRGKSLEELGRSEPLGHDISGARFIRKRAFVLQKPYTQPLLTLDLSDPARPVRGGDLKVPGLLTYLHPLGPDHLLAVGLQTSPRGDLSGPKLSIFDVSDLAAPRETHTLILAPTGHSAALIDHHAFNFLAERRLLALPVAIAPSMRVAATHHELVLFSVDAQTGFDRKGALAMTDLVPVNGLGREFGIQRSVLVSDEQGRDFLYGFGYDGLRVAGVDDLAQSLASAPLPAVRRCVSGGQGRAGAVMP
jgi:hypothetical protein